MSQHYSNPARESETHALPDVEVFSEHYCTDERHDGICIHADGECMACHDECDPQDLHVGWFWQSCFPGCLPDSDPIGPFETHAEALADAQPGND